MGPDGFDALRVLRGQQQEGQVTGLGHEGAGLHGQGEEEDEPVVFVNNTAEKDVSSFSVNQHCKRK